MEIYDSCGICSKWDDLIMWKSKEGITLATVCSNCYDKLDSYSIKFGQTKTNTLNRLRSEQEKSDGKE